MVVVFAVVAVGFFVGFVVARTGPRYALLLAVGEAVLVYVFVHLVLSGPAGEEGWANRTRLYGHWIDDRDANLTVSCAFAWSLGLSAGALGRRLLLDEPATRRARRPARPS